MIQTHTDSNGNQVTIDFDDLQYQLLESDGEERSGTYEARGTGSDGKTYSAICEFSCGEFDSMDETSIEPVTWK